MWQNSRTRSTSTMPVRCYGPFNFFFLIAYISIMHFQFHMYRKKFTLTIEPEKRLEFGKVPRGRRPESPGGHQHAGIMRSWNCWCRDDEQPFPIALPSSPPLASSDWLRCQRRIRSWYWGKWEMAVGCGCGSRDTKQPSQLLLCFCASQINS